MGLHYSSAPTANTTLVTTAETVVATVSGVSVQRPGQTARCRGQVQITTGTNTTALTLRVRRGGLTGTVVGEANAVQVEAAAGSTEDHDYYGEDAVSTEMAGETYVLTVAQTGATANGTAVYASLDVDVA